MVKKIVIIANKRGQKWNRNEQEHTDKVHSCTQHTDSLRAKEGDIINHIL